MTIQVSLQRIGRKRPTVQPTAMEIGRVPGTVGELIRLCAESCVAAHNRRAAEPDERLLSEEQIEDLLTVGRVAFGVDENGALADPAAAVANALQSYEDGLFRVFLNGTALGELDERIDLRAQDVLTFVRLTMLAGGGW